MALGITLSTYTGKFGEPVTITAGGAVFNTPYTKNVVTFNGVIADILSGSATTLTVTIPQLADTGYVVVETFLDVDPDDRSATSPQEFEVQFDDDAFPDNVSEPDLYHKGYINNRVKTLFTNPSPSASYNRDFSYSNFVEIVDENSMVQNFLSLILTNPLERMWEPDFGSSIPRIPFTLITTEPDELESEILNEAERLVNENEPRITLIKSQSIVAVDPDSNKMNVIFAIRVPTGEIAEVGVTLGQVQNETM